MDILKNNQWLVDEDGLHSIPPGAKYEYIIAASRLLETGGAGQGKFYDWPIQLAHKTRIDIEAFIAAFDKSLECHTDKYKGELDKEILSNSYAEARRIAADHHKNKCDAG